MLNLSRIGSCAPVVDTCSRFDRSVGSSGHITCADSVARVSLHRGVSPGLALHRPAFDRSSALAFQFLAFDLDCAWRPLLTPSIIPDLRQSVVGKASSWVLASLAWVWFVSMLVLAQEHTDYMLWSSAVHYLRVGCAWRPLLKASLVPDLLCPALSWAVPQCYFVEFDCARCCRLIHDCCFVEFDCARCVRCLMAGD
jgi:hypothetical protein